MAELQDAFDSLFISPFAYHHWASQRGRSRWVEVEGWQDSMAGPLSAIIRTGGCEYVYLRNDVYFTSVSDPPSLLTRLLEWHTGLVGGVEGFAPATAEQATDLAFMRSLVGRMRNFVERAFAVEQSRWESTRHTDPSGSDGGA